MTNSEEIARPLPDAVAAEVGRIRATMVPSGGDKEDLITYAKDVLEWRSRALAAESERDALREALERVIDQYRIDLATAHAEICKLQGLDPQAHSWPDWSPQANTLRWLPQIEEQFAIRTRTEGGENGR